jgi:hypothetical protein
MRGFELRNISPALLRKGFHELGLNLKSGVWAGGNYAGCSSTRTSCSTSMSHEWGQGMLKVWRGWIEAKGRQVGQLTFATRALGILSKISLAGCSLAYC